MQETNYPDIKGLSVKNFIGQLDYILKHYAVIGLEDYLESLERHKDIPKSSCILTFDDGFKDHYLNVFPILKDKKLQGSFFPITQPLTEFVVPAVHKTHFLLAKLGSALFADEFNQILKNRLPELIEKFFIDSKFKKEKKYRWDDSLTANLKYNIAAMPASSRTEILNQIFNKYFTNEKEFCQELYLSFEEMKEMRKAGLSFGGHSHTHPLLCQLSRSEQQKELKTSKEILEKELQTEITLFSYPYGSFDGTTIEILKRQGYICGLTTDIGLNQGEKVDIFKLKRLDTNDLPFN